MSKKPLKNNWRKLDNTAKIFSLDDKKNVNIFRYSIILKENIDCCLLKYALIEALEQYPTFKVKLGSGLFWNYLEENLKEPIVLEEQEMPCEYIHYRKNNDYLFRVTYFRNKINLDIFHVLTDGLGAAIFLKAILYQYLNLKYHLKTNEKAVMANINLMQDQYLNNTDKKIIVKEKAPKPFLIKEDSDLTTNKTYHYILDLASFKTICKETKVSITEYLTALYICALYKSVYDRTSDKDIVITIPIDLRRHYQVETFFNFFTCMNVVGKVSRQKSISFQSILKQVHKEFTKKLTKQKIKEYLSHDVRLGTNIIIRLVPLFIKKLVIRNFGKLVSQTSTSTLSNLGLIEIEKQYQKYVDNIMILVNAGKFQKTKCTICSYKNNLTVTLNSNLTSSRLEKEFYKLLVKYVGKVKLESNIE